MNADHLERLVGTLGGTTLKERRDRALVLLLLSSGARVSELLRLDRRDWSHNRLMLRGKGSRKRTVVVTSSARKAVDEYLQARGKLGDPSTALFIGFQPALTRASSKRLSATGGRHVLQGSRDGQAFRRFIPTDCATHLGASSSGRPAILALPPPPSATRIFAPSRDTFRSPLTGASQRERRWRPPGCSTLRHVRWGRP